MTRKTDTVAPCAVCGRPALAEYRPFCSRRCSDVDLQRWLSGRYAVPAVEADDKVDEHEDPV
jgi:endogenous inhibitor of DNA gyrase (YacG/DUF329 family)